MRRLVSLLSVLVIALGLAGAVQSTTATFVDTADLGMTLSVPVTAAAALSKIDVGTGFVCALDDNGERKCWGTNSNLQIGDGHTRLVRTAPTAVMNGAVPPTATFTSAAMGSAYDVCASDDRGALYCWGINQQGQLGDGSQTYRTLPTAVAQGAVPVGASIVAYSVGGQHSCLVADNGKAYCWGLNSSGQLGDNTTTARLVPTQVVAGAVPGGVKLIGISAGGNHTCAVDENGKSYCWGMNASGQVGDNSTTQRLTPTAVAAGVIPGGTALTKIVSGATHTCAVAGAAGKAYCWGSNSVGELGDASTTQRLTPVAVAAGAIPGTAKVVTVVAGQSNTCALDDSGKAYCWGQNNNGQVGNGGTVSPQTSPVAVVQGAIPAGDTIASLAASAQHVCALTGTGSAYCWGANTAGELGIGATSNRSTSPAAVLAGAIPAGTALASITVGNIGTCAIDVAGAMYCWGSSTAGRHGVADIIDALTPTGGPALPGGLRAVSVTAGAFHACAIDEAGQAYCWGKNANGQTGIGSTAPSEINTPMAVAAGAIPAGVKITKLTGGRDHTCALDENGKAYCWGSNSSGQLGDNSVTQRTAPVAVAAGAVPVGVKLIDIFAGLAQTCALGDNGKAYCWGSNSNGQLGDNSTTQRLVPVAVAAGAIPGTVKLTSITTGNYHSCGTGDNGVSYCWGYNTDGELGDSTTTQRLVPVATVQGAVPAGAKLTTVTAGTMHTCAIDDSGRAFCWGQNGGGILGEGGTATKYVPTAVAQGEMPVGARFTSISADGVVTCGTVDDGRVYCWGTGANGALGNGTTTSAQRTPVAVLNS